MALTIRKYNKDIIEEVKELTGRRSASTAMNAGLVNYVSLVEQHRELQEEHDDLLQEHEKVLSLLKRRQKIDQEVDTLIAQED